MHSHILTTLLLFSLSPSPLSFNHHNAAGVALAIPIPSLSNSEHHGSAPALTRRQMMQPHWDDDPDWTDWTTDGPEDDIFEVYFKNRSEHWDLNHQTDRTLWGYNNKKAYMDDVRKGAILNGWVPRTRRRHGTSSPAAATETQRGQEEEGDKAQAGTDDNNLMKVKLDFKPWLSNLGRTLKQSEAKMMQQSSTNMNMSPPGGSSNRFGIGGVAGSSWMVPRKMMVVP